jgi:Mor family transcriptional regulator
MPKGNNLTKKYRFSQKELERVVPKGKSLAKKYKFSHEKIEGRYIRGW